MSTPHLLQTILSFLSFIPLLIIVIGSVILMRKVTAASTILIFLGNLLVFLLVLGQRLATLPPINIVQRMNVEQVGHFFMGIQSLMMLANLLVGVGLLLFALNLPVRRRHP